MSDLYPQVEAAIRDILNDVARNDAEAIRRLSGRGGKLRSAKPKDDGIYAYIWRQCTFHSGIDPTMPVMADLDLQNGIEAALRQRGITEFRALDPNAQFAWNQKQGIHYRDMKFFKAEIDKIDARRGLVDRVLVHFGLDPLGAARRWRGLLASQLKLATQEPSTRVAAMLSEELGLQDPQVMQRARSLARFGDFFKLPIRSMAWEDGTFMLTYRVDHKLSITVVDLLSLVRQKGLVKIQCNDPGQLSFYFVETSKLTAFRPEPAFERVAALPRRIPLGRLDELRRDPKAHLIIIRPGNSFNEDYEVKAVASREALMAFLDREALKSNGGWSALVKTRKPRNMGTNRRYEYEDSNWVLPQGLHGEELRDFIRKGQDNPNLYRTAAVQKLMTAEIRRRIPQLYAQENSKDPTVYAKFFNAYGAGTWLATEFDGQDTFFGWVEIHPGMGELGYFSLRELENTPARFGGRIVRGLQGIERDSSFTPKPLSQAKRS